MCFTHFAVCVCYTGQPVVPSQANLVSRSLPTAANTQFRPRVRFPAAPRTGASSTSSMSATSRAPGVTLRPRTAVETRSARPPRPTAVVQNVTTASVPQGTNTLPVPRRSMAPSRIAAIMMRRQYSSDRVFVFHHPANFYIILSLSFCELCFI